MKGHIRRRGENSWELKFDIGNDPVTGARRVRYHSFRGTKKKAQARLVELMASVGAETYVDANKVTVAEHVGARIDLWEQSGEISAKTAERYRGLLNKQMVPHIGGKLLQKLRTVDIEQWHSTLQTKGRADGKGGISNRTIGHAHRVLGKALREAARHDLVIRNVAAEEGAPTVSDEEMVILTPDQLASLPALLAGKPLLTRAMVLVQTGMRRGELLALKWRRVDLDAKTVEIEETVEQTKAHGIRAKRPKTKYSRRKITLADATVDRLREHRRSQLEQRVAMGLGRLDDDALVFPAVDGGLDSPDALSKAWSDFAADKGLLRASGKAVPLHALRHTHASQLIDAGVDVVTVSRRLGHASPAITLKIYAHLFRKDDSKAAAAINAALSGG
jgi:integrase